MGRATKANLETAFPAPPQAVVLVWRFPYHKLGLGRLLSMAYSSESYVPPNFFSSDSPTQFAHYFIAKRSRSFDTPWEYGLASCENHLFSSK